MTVTEGFLVTICDPRAVDFGESTAKALFGPEGFLRLANPIMGAEDFSYVLEKLPGAMFFIGASPQGEDWTQCCGIHSTRMMLDEAMLPNGAAMLAALGQRFLENGFA